MARWPKEISKAKRKNTTMPFDANPQHPTFLNEKARRLLEAHDREVGRKPAEHAMKVEFARRNQNPYSEVA